MEGILVVVFFGLMGAVGIHSTLRERRSVSSAVAAFARFLGGTSACQRAEGVYEGVQVDVELFTGDESEGDWTEVRAFLPNGYPFVLHIDSHQVNDHRRIRCVSTILRQPSDEFTVALL